MADENKKLTLPQEEEKILEFWDKNHIFEKTLKKTRRGKRFVFYDGPPFATGLPHYGHILASVVKDAVPRYWTMRGFRVDRRWGWDCHGLPIENLVEQELKIAGRKSIEKFGIKNFNERARSIVLTYTSEWFQTVRRIGRFVDFQNAYTTMDPTYMESVWWAFAELYKKGLVYHDARVALFCSRCETQLSNFEITMDNSYRDHEDDSVYVKVRLQETKNEFLLIWSTTPWTLPGNAAIAVNSKREYTKFRVGKEYIWAATPPPHELGNTPEVVEKCSGKTLVGKKYVPLFSLTKDPNAYRVVSADFVDIAEGTGLVHIAPAFGDEDFTLGKKEKLPILGTLDDTGRFNTLFPELHFLAGKKTAEANRIMIDWLGKRHALWKVHRITHRYPICWRCATPLIYKVEPAWFIKLSEIKADMLALNEKIDWHPEHLKRGRFGNDLASAPDWNISRSRFWGTPIPIWKCAQCKKTHVIGSRDEFNKKSESARNNYFIMRHGEAENNVKSIISSLVPEKKKYHLTLKGKIAVEKTAQKLKKEKIDFIVSSDFTRTKETAELAASALGVKVHFDPRLHEIRGLDGEKNDEVKKYILAVKDRLTAKVPDGETLPELRKRTYAVVMDLEKKYQGKNILIVSHEHPLWALYAASMGLSNEEMLALRASTGKDGFVTYAEVKKMPYRHVPRNDTGELDFHRPYIDEVPLFCDCGSALKRIPDVFDCWFESGSMPFAEKHYPFENKKIFEENFPADFISEYPAQTRGWFSKLHVLSTALFSRPAFKHVIVSGTILAENGEKLSKSRKNFPDPWALFSRYGVDPIRFYLLSSPVMLADNINFSEKDVDGIYKKYSLIVSNVLNIFRLYQHGLKGTMSKQKSKHVLDRWILSRLHSTITDVTNGFDSYELLRATRPLGDFVQDMSLWYVRRSRDRIKSGTQDGAHALATLRTVLFEFARISAPTTPFLAEMIYRDLDMKRKQSVHLEDWPKPEKKLIDKKLEEKMTLARTIASEALRARAEAKIKVRQPLKELRIKNKELRGEGDLLGLIRDEVHVKEITFGDELWLDTEITPELREEGLAREFTRNIQEMRRELGITPRTLIHIQISGDKNLEASLLRWGASIKKDTNARELKIGGKKVFALERDFSLDGAELWIGIEKV